MKYLLNVLLVFIICIGAVSAQDSSSVNYEVKVSKILMGTLVETVARSKDIPHCKQSLYYAYREMERVENLLAYQKKDSEISKINNAAGKHPVHVSAETFAILQRAVNYAQKLDGVFDVTIGPVTSLWGFSSPEGGHLPPRDEIMKCLPLVDYRKLVFNTKDTTVFLKKSAMMIDLGGIAKGYAIDRGSTILKENGITNFILNAGGDMYVSGQKDENTLWKVGIKDPRDGQKLVVSFDLKDYAVATSGDYERFIIVDGQRYHHIIDSRNGYPARFSQSSTTLASTAEEADMLATYLFIIGAQEALKKNLPIPFLIIDANSRKIANDLFKNLPALQY